MFALKEYNAGAYGLQIYFGPVSLYDVQAGEIVCMADEDGKALDMCQSMGFSNVPYATVNLAALGLRVNYYKKM